MNQIKIGSRIFIKLFVTLFSVTLLLSLIVMMVYEYNLMTELTSSVIEEETIAVNTLTQVIGKDLKNVISDLEFMQFEILTHELHGDDLENMWVNFLKSKKFYDQIRFIDYQGNELIRVNYNNGKVESVQKNSLQSKTDRYYFQESIILNDGEIYVSKLDLNIENGIVESPEKPVLRIGLRIKNDELNGVILVNYLAEHLLDDITLFNQSTSGSFYVINLNEDYVFHEISSKNFRFMYPNPEEGNFEIDYPGIISKHNDSDYVLEGNQLYIIRELDFNSMMEYDSTLVHANEQLRVINHVDGLAKDVLLNPQISTIFKQVIIKNRYAVLIILLGTLLISYLQYRIKKSKKIVRELFEKDALTNIYNRRAGMQYFNQMIKHSEMSNDEISVVFIDVDGLKQINDGLGHEYGDDLLVTITEVIKEEIRDDDLLFRLGGDEFLLVLERIGTKGSKHVMLRIQAHLSDINATDEKVFNMSISFGITSTYELSTLKVEDLLRVSDEKMYASKHKKNKGNMVK